MESEQSVCLPGIQIKILRTFFTRLAIALIAFSIGYGAVILFRQPSRSSSQSSASASINQIPLEGPHAPNIMRPTSPAQIYNRVTGQWEVEKSDEVPSLAEGAKPKAPRIVPLENRQSLSE